MGAKQLGKHKEAPKRAKRVTKASKKAAETPKYWREKVGKSGVYPMSGPLPKGDAPLRGQMEFGQGERGAAGYYDAGGSELVFSGGQVLGGLTAGAGGAPRGETPRRWPLRPKK